MKRTSHITLADIAGRLNVSRVTVSKALRGHPDISEGMAAQVRKVAAELGYSPNLMARNLSARHSQMIGLVVPKIAHYFFGSVIEAIYHAAGEQKYETILTVSHEDAEQERKHLKTLVSMRVDGIIISVSRQTRDLQVFDWIRSMGIPLVFMDRLPEPPPRDPCAVVVDDRGGAALAVEQAIAAGYRRIACVGGDQNMNIGKERIAGYVGALGAHGIPVREDWIVPGGLGMSDGFQGLKQLKQSGALPECVFALTYPVALGIYEAAKALGVRIPQDLDVICFGDSDVGHLISPAISCINQPTRGLGDAAVRLLMRMINEPAAVKPERIVIPTELVLRETCLGRNAAARGAEQPGMTR